MSVLTTLYHVVWICVTIINDPVTCFLYMVKSDHVFTFFHLLIVGVLIVDDHIIFDSFMDSVAIEIRLNYQ